MTPPIQSTAERIDRDRREAEEAALLLALVVARRSFRHAAYAVRHGQDVERAAREVLHGTKGLGDSIADGMTRAYIAGDRRAKLIATQTARQTRHMVRLRTPAPGLSLERMREVRQAMKPKADRIADRLARPLLDDLAQVRVNPARFLPPRGPVFTTPPATILQPTGPVLDLNALLRITAERFRQGGIAPGYTRNLETMLEGAVAEAFQGGMDAGNETPAIAEALWGYRYSAVLDQRTTRLCRGLDGAVTPKSDPFWRKWAPPNHWHCRSVLIPVYTATGLREPEIIQPSATVDELIAFEEIKRKFLSYLN